MDSSHVQNQEPPSYLLPSKLWFHDNIATNYVVWRAQCLDLFQCQNVLPYIDGTIIIPSPPVVGSDPEQDMLRAKGGELKEWMLSVVDHGVADLTNIETKTCREIWLELETKYQQSFGQVPTWSAGYVDSRASNEYLSIYEAAIRGDEIAVKHLFDNDIGYVMMENPNISSVQSEGSATTYNLKVNLLGPKPDVEIITAPAKDELAGMVIFPKHTVAIYAQMDVLEYLKSLIMDVESYDQNRYTLAAGFGLLLTAIDAQYLDFALELVKEYPRLATLNLSSKSALSYCAGIQVQQHPGNFLSLVRKISTRHTRQKIRKGKVRMLVKHICEEIRDRLNPADSEDIYRNAILLAARLGKCVIVEEILKVFPAAVTCSDPASLRNIFHMAVESRSEDIFDLACQKISSRPHSSKENPLRLYMNMSDVKGNNLLHLAAKLPPPGRTQLTRSSIKDQIEHELMWYQQIGKIVHPSASSKLNGDGQIPKMIFDKEHKGVMDEAKTWVKDTSTACTFVSALICTIGFAGVITIPGGNDSDKGYPMFTGISQFESSYALNATSLMFSASSLMMFVRLLSWGQYDIAHFRGTVVIMLLGVWLLLGSIIAMLLSSAYAIGALLANNDFGSLQPTQLLVYIAIGFVTAIFMPQVIELASSSITSASRKGKRFLRGYPPFEYHGN